MLLLQNSDIIIRGEEVMHFIWFIYINHGRKYHTSGHLSPLLAGIKSQFIYFLIERFNYHGLKYGSRELLIMSPLLAGLETHFNI